MYVLQIVLKDVFGGKKKEKEYDEPQDLSRIDCSFDGTTDQSMSFVRARCSISVITRLNL